MSDNSDIDEDAPLFKKSRALALEEPVIKLEPLDEHDDDDDDEDDDDKILKNYFSSKSRVVETIEQTENGLLSELEGVGQCSTDALFSSPVEKCSQYTEESSRCSVRQFVLYLNKVHNISDFPIENFSKSQLALYLEEFFVNMRRHDGTPYKANTIKVVRAGLNRYLKQRYAELQLGSIDVVTDPEFVQCDRTLKQMLHQMRHDDVNDESSTSAVLITFEDEQKLCQYFSKYQESSTILLHKVLYNLMYSFKNCNRATLVLLSIEHFLIGVDTFGRRLVMLVDDSNSYAAASKMVERPNDDLCPVRSFIFYLSKLSNETNRLLQRPNSKFHSSDKVWFSGRPMGKNALGNIMKEVSEIAGLSHHYNTRSVHATAKVSRNHVGLGKVIAEQCTSLAEFIKGEKMKETLLHYGCEKSKPLLPFHPSSSKTLNSPRTERPLRPKLITQPSYVVTSFPQMVGLGGHPFLSNIQIPSNGNLGQAKKPNEGPSHSPGPSISSSTDTPCIAEASPSGVGLWEFKRLTHEARQMPLNEWSLRTVSAERLELCTVKDYFVEKQVNIDLGLSSTLLIRGLVVPNYHVNLTRGLEACLKDLSCIQICPGIMDSSLYSKLRTSDDAYVNVTWNGSSSSCQAFSKHCDLVVEDASCSCTACGLAARKCIGGCGKDAPLAKEDQGIADLDWENVTTVKDLKHHVMLLASEVAKLKSFSKITEL